ncbi:unnamed protein product [Chondrus crispus]|uniref:Uncharacterized protein n=1 Tax=Chondrus crispus TaxID=2769 RepID=R7QR59_CHOCR|nr:unnamed protein product [Chondrus crispus]CDF40248.1 unnamed protein product [Chondrus crispus]|eukprot:XP_005710542.1 unnamed protein product [Chondrus crispus]
MRIFPVCQSIRETLLNTVHSRCLHGTWTLFFTLTVTVSR